MTETTEPRQPDPGRGRGDGGTALVEFALVSVLLFTLVFAIINFGLILSFKQDMTRAAAEGARAGAVASRSDVYGTNDPRRLAAVQATDEALAGFEQSCTGGMTCTISAHDCDDPVPDTNGYHEKDPAANTQPANTENDQPDCVTVELVFDYENHPLLAPVPLIAAFLPDEITARSVARLNS